MKEFIGYIVIILLVTLIVDITIHGHKLFTWQYDEKIHVLDIGW